MARWDGRRGRARAWLAGAGPLAVALAAGLAGCKAPWADRTAIEGVVSNAAGGAPEAGVWVIAETASLPTPFRKIVVTDDRGRFLVPDLPAGAYHVWVRGYGLKDSAPVDAAPGGDDLKLKVASAADAREAARVYPAQYWLSLYEPPPLAALPKATGAGGQVAPGPVAARDEWIAQFKLGCMVCHQIGAEITRALSSPQDFETTWRKAGVMSLTADALGREPLKASLVDWERRIAAGETPPPPPRPSGAERNIVITEWQWGAFNSYMHDEIATDKRNPTLYPYGPVWGLDIGTDTLWKLDPKTNQVSSFHVPVRGDYHESWSKSFSSWSAYTWVANPHNPMMDEKGRVWITTQVRDKYRQPKWEAQDLVYQAGFAPPAGGPAKGGAMQTAEGERTDANSSGRQLGYFDTKTEKFVLIDTIYGTHHLQFDAKGRIWTSLDPRGVGMFDPALFDPAHPEATEGRAQKLFLKVDPKTGQSLTGGGYGIAVDPVDQTIWRANPVAIGAANKLMKYDPRTNVHTDYVLPAPLRGPRGIDFTTDGKVWFATGSGHLGRLDPATGKFSWWVLPGPRLKGTGPETGSAEMPYYVWVDQFDTFGLGKDMVITTGTDSDSLVIFDPKTEKFTVIRVPYPLSFYHRGLDGRIDDEKAGWKGRGLWATYGEDPALFIEGAQRSNLVHIQMRPSPLAR